MPRARRYFHPGYVWHITQRCHNKCFLLKFAQDRQRWIEWLYEAKHRFGLCVLNYIVTSNHIHLLVYDTGEEVISNSLQLIAGQTGREYNQRKNRKGSFWEDRYHATAIEAGDHLFRCLVYIDLNMVRAGIVNHPSEWPHSGYHELQKQKQRYQIIDHKSLLALFDSEDLAGFQAQHRDWIDEALKRDSCKRETHWTNSLAIGSERFIKAFQTQQGIWAKYRTVNQAGDQTTLEEPPAVYEVNIRGERRALSGNNAVIWVGS